MKRIKRYYKKTFFPVFMAFLVFAVCVGISPGQELSSENLKKGVPPQNNPVGKLKDLLLTYLNPANGTIKSASGEHVTVSFETEEKLKKGMRFSVFRGGKPFYHPVTKEPIGQSESLIGKIEVIKEQEESNQDDQKESLYHCRIISGNPEIGDIVRITSSVINLAFFQDKRADWALSEAFYTDLKDSGRFNLLESYTKSYEPRELSSLAKKLNADIIVLFSTPSRDNSIFVNAKLFWPEDASMFAEIEEIVSADLVKELAILDDLISLSAIEGVPWGSYRLASGKLIAMGDVTGNNERELVVSDGHAIRIYEYQKEPREIWSIQGNNWEKHLALDVLDLNGNGKAEIFVTSLFDVDLSPEISETELARKKNKRRIVSSAIEFDPAEGYRKIWNSRSYATRVMGSTLLMQKFTPNMTFTGPVSKGVWRDGRYETGDSLKLPEGVDIYGFTFIDWGNTGKVNVLTFDEFGYLNLFSEGELLWKSKKSYGNPMENLTIPLQCRAIRFPIRKIYGLLRDDSCLSKHSRDRKS
ncbi:VCBS repeat-containing protein [bacterium]|nr:MAG: VCBS repeat-containing protein [bacterium]